MAREARGWITMPITKSDTTPYWSTSTTFPQFAKLADDAEADVVVVGAFTVHLRPGLNRMWFAQIADFAGHRTTVRGRGREGAVREARRWCARAVKKPEDMRRQRRRRPKAPS